MLGDRPLALDSLRALRSSDVTEAALVAARNLPGRLEADDDRQEKLESPDELHGSGGMSTSNHYRRRSLRVAFLRRLEGPAEGGRRCR